MITYFRWQDGRIDRFDHFAPLTVLTGIYGMNFDHLPELHWRYGYFFVLALVVAIPLALYYWFQRKGWI